MNGAPVIVGYTATDWWCSLMDAAFWVDSSLKLAALCAVVLGWLIVNNQNNFREDRKEARDVMIKLQDLIESITSCAESYHVAASADVAKAHKIKNDLAMASARLQRLHAFGVGSEHAKGLFIEFRQSITAKNFDTASFSQQSHSSDTVLDISYFARLLFDELDGCYVNTFPRKSRDWLLKL